MKINFQKIFAITCAVCVMSCFAVPISATDISGGITSGGGGEGGSRTAYGNGIAVYIESVGDYIDGKITYDEFVDKAAQIEEEYAEDMSNRLGLGFMSEINGKIAETYTQYKLNAPYYLKQWYQDFLKDYTDLAQIESPNNPDKKGYGAVAYAYYSSNPNTCHYLYADYIVITKPNANGYYSAIGYCLDATSDDNGVLYSVSFNGGISYTDSYHGIQYGLSVDPETAQHRYIYSFYGDIRYEDGTQAPTDDEFVDTEVLDFSNASDKDLEDLLEKLLNKLNLEMPDLSSIEGLLTSIYVRLGSLDSDNDDELLSQVLVAIQSLQGTDNSELLEVLNEIKDKLTNGTTDDNTDLSEKLENMITVEDFTIDEEAYRNNSAVLKLRLQEKFIFTDELKNLVTYTFDSYSNASENPQLNLKYNDKSYVMDLSAYDEYMPTLRFIIAAFTYITYAYHTYRKIPSYINGGDNE